jgi:hypothetical protein
MKSLNDYSHHREYEKIVSKATATENGLTFELINNPELEIAKWKIDNGVLNHQDGSKCDYLMIVKDRSTCYWIELKDEDFDDACLQIYSAIKNIAESREYQTHYARIVLGRFKEDRNRIDNFRYINHKKLINTIGGNENIKYKTKILTEELQ